MAKNLVLKFIFITLLFILNAPAYGHHILGRPSYSLNEDSNTPPSMQMEAQIGEYFVTYMVYPAFPRPAEPGRIHLYVSRLDNGETFDGRVAFKVKDDSWFGSGKEETIGVQSLDANVYRQGFIFKNSGDFIVTAEFEAGGQPYVIDFPLRIGATPLLGPVGIAMGLVLIVLVVVSVLQRKRLLAAKMRQSQEEKTQ